MPAVLNGTLRVFGGRSCRCIGGSLRNLLLIFVGLAGHGVEVLLSGTMIGSVRGVGKSGLSGNVSVCSVGAATTVQLRLSEMRRQCQRKYQTGQNPGRAP